MGKYPEKVSAPLLELRISEQGDAVVVKCAGRLAAENAGALKEQVKNMIPHEKRIGLDLTDLAGMDSSGLGAVVSLYVSGRKAKCEIQLVHLSVKVRELLGMSNLLSVFADCGNYGVRMP
jgi:anti-sigma B factor antagonist